MISLAMQGLLNDGDEILIPAPDYPLWTAAAKLAGGTPVHYICDEKSNWYPDIADMEKKINSRTKGIVIINPNNPTGALYPKEVLEQIVELARRHELILFADEIYDLSLIHILLCIEKKIPLDDLPLEEYKKISPVFEEDIYEAISMKTLSLIHISCYRIFSTGR